jgi:hypothetical protein
LQTALQSRALDDQKKSGSVPKASREADRQQKMELRAEAMEDCKSEAPMELQRSVMMDEEEVEERSCTPRVTQPFLLVRTRNHLTCSAAACADRCSSCVADRRQKKVRGCFQQVILRADL